jgi:hypothetical protein
MLLFRGRHWDNLHSPEEIQEAMSRWTAWFDRLSQQGKAKAGQPLRNEGVIVSGKKGVSVLDGPFAESKETIAGYIFLQVNDLDEAVEIAKECPGLEYGVSVEVRAVEGQMGPCAGFVRNFKRTTDQRLADPHGLGNIDVLSAQSGSS